MHSPGHTKLGHRTVPNEGAFARRAPCARSVVMKPCAKQWVNGPQIRISCLRFNESEEYESRSQTNARTLKPGITAAVACAQGTRRADAPSVMQQTDGKTQCAISSRPCSDSGEETAGADAVPMHHLSPPPQHGQCATTAQ